MSTTQQNAIQAGAELLAESAKDIGQKCRIVDGVEAVVVLERALAIAWADVSLFLGANDTPERLEETIRVMTKRIADEVRAQHFLRKGSRPFLKGH